MDICFLIGNAHLQASQGLNSSTSLEHLRCLEKPKTSHVSVFLQQGAQPGNANLPMPPNPMDAGGPATRIVQLTEAVTLEELANDEEYQDIVDDMREECGKVTIS